MKEMSISDFKTHALRIIDGVFRTGERIIITRRGKPVAEVIPFENTNEKPIPGKLADTLLYESDIVSPLGPDMWEAKDTMSLLYQPFLPGNSANCWRKRG